MIAGRLSKVAGRAAHRHPHRVPLVRDGATPRRPSPSAWTDPARRTVAHLVTAPGHARRPLVVGTTRHGRLVVVSDPRQVGQERGRASARCGAATSRTPPSGQQRRGGAGVDRPATAPSAARTSAARSPEDPVARRPRAAALSSTASRTGPARPAEHRAEHRRVDRRVAAAQVVAGRRRARRVRRGRGSRRRTSPPPDHPDRAGGRGGQLVEPVVAAHDQRRRPARRRTPRPSPAPAGRRRSRPAPAARLGRVGQRAEHVHRGRDAQLAARHRRCAGSTGGTPARSRTRCRPRATQRGHRRPAAGRSPPRAPPARRPRRRPTTPPGCRA